MTAPTRVLSAARILTGTGASPEHCSLLLRAGTIAEMTATPPATDAASGVSGPEAEV